MADGGFDHDTGKNCYVLIRNDDQEVWNGSSFEDYVTANLATYAITATEQGTASGYYTYAIPFALPDERFDVVAKELAGVSPAESDDTVGVGTIDLTVATGGGGGGECVGTGEVEVNHDYGGADNLSYQTATGVAIDNAEIQVFTKTDWDAGNRTPNFAVAFARTTADSGRWSQSVMLDPDTYVLRFSKQGHMGPDIKEIEVTDD